MGKTSPMLEYMMWFAVVVSAFLMMSSVAAIVPLVMAVMIGVRIREARHKAEWLRVFEEFAIDSVKVVYTQLENAKLLAKQTQALQDEVQRFSTSLQLARMVNKNQFTEGTPE